MITEFSGKRYYFQIRVEKDRCRSVFSIRAISKDAGKYSSINNLNAILAELGIDSYDRKYDDSSWVLPIRESNRYENTIKESLSSIRFVRYLESKLDEDRECGEWANSLSDNRVN